MIKVCLLDLDETLFDFKTSEKNAVIKTFNFMGFPADEKVAEMYSRINALYWKEHEKGLISIPDLKVKRYEKLLSNLGIDADAKNTTRIYEGFLSEGFDLLDGAKELLDSLNGKYRLMVVSNGTASVQYSRLSKSGIDKYFEKVFLSQEIGFSKPDKRFFDYCFSNIDNFSKDECIIIGDSLSSDIKGGIDSGIKVCWFNPKNLESPDLPIDYTVTSLSQIPDILKSK